MRGIEGRDDLRTVRAKVTGQLLTLDATLQDTVPAVLALPSGARYGRRPWRMAASRAVSEQAIDLRLGLCITLNVLGEVPELMLDNSTAWIVAVVHGLWL